MEDNSNFHPYFSYILLLFYRKILTYDIFNALEQPLSRMSNLLCLIISLCFCRSNFRLLQMVERQLCLCLIRQLLSRPISLLIHQPKMPTQNFRYAKAQPSGQRSPSITFLMCFTKLQFIFTYNTWLVGNLALFPMLLIVLFIFKDIDIIFKKLYDVLLVINKI